MLAVADTVPDAAVWLGPRERMTIREIAAEGPILLFFYLFDWTGT